MVKSAWLGALAWLLLLYSPRPTSAEVVQLTALEQRALQNRPALEGGRSRTRAASAELEGAQNAYFPRLSLDAQSLLGPGRELIEVREDLPGAPDEGDIFLVPGARKMGNSGAFLPSFSNRVELAVKGSIYDFGRTSSAVDAARAVRASTEAEEEVTRALIVRAVRDAYLNWLGQTEMLGLAEQTASDAESAKQRVQQLIDEGALAKSALSSAQADEMLAKLSLERARGAARASRLALEHAVGSALPASAEPDRALLRADRPAAASSADAARIRALELKRSAASAEAHRLDLTDSPVLAGELSVGMRSQDGNLFPAYAAGVSFSLPLWDATDDGRERAARARADVVAAELHEQRQTQTQARQRAELDLANASAQVDAAEALLEVVRQRLSEAEQANDLGSAGIEALTAARALLHRAQTELLQAKLARAEAAIRMR